VTEQRGEVVASAYTWDEGHMHVSTRTGWIHSDHRRRGLGTALVREVERRALRDRAQLPAGSALRVLQSFDADASGARDPDASGARILFESLGYGPDTEYLHMEIEVSKELAVGDAPAGIVVRSRTAADDRDIVAVMADAFDDPWDYEEARQEFLASKTYDPFLWLIALDGDEAVGALFGYLTNGRGQISALGVRDGWRRRGIAQALLRGAFVRFRDRGGPRYG
jgi:ribosomal protein S18 acetylase RimI-like enzyme